MVWVFGLKIIKDQVQKTVKFPHSDFEFRLLYVNKCEVQGINDNIYQLSFEAFSQPQISMMLAVLAHVVCNAYTSQRPALVPRLLLIIGSIGNFATTLSAFSDTNIQTLLRIIQAHVVCKICNSVSNFVILLFGSVSTHSS